MTGNESRKESEAYTEAIPTVDACPTRSDQVPSQPLRLSNPIRPAPEITASNRIAAGMRLEQSAPEEFSAEKLAKDSSLVQKDQYHSRLRRTVQERHGQNQQSHQSKNSAAWGAKVIHATIEQPI